MQNQQFTSKKKVFEVFRKGGLMLPRYHPYYQQRWENMICRDLTIRYKEYNSDEWQTSLFFTLKPNFLYIPRWYPLAETIINPDEYSLQITDLGEQGVPFENADKARSKITEYREGQKEAVNFILDSCLRLRKDPIIKLRPGAGKTVICLDALCKMKTKAIVLVNRTDVQIQWQNRVKEFTENVSTQAIPSYEDPYYTPPDIAVTTIQKVLAAIRRDPIKLYNTLRKYKFGIVIFDEVHSLIGPEEFTKVALAFTAKSYIFLSATPYRTGPFAKIFKYWTGSNIFVGKYDIKPVIYTCIIPSSIKPKTWKYINWGGRFNPSRYLKCLSSDLQYIEGLVSLIRTIKEFDPRRNILILAERVKLLENLADHFKGECGKYYQSNSMDNLNHDIVFASYAMCKQAIDAPHLNTLIYATPPRKELEIEQSVGRILRSAGKDVDIDPIVIDVIDGNSAYMSGKYKYRLSIYTETFKWPVFPLSHLFSDKDKVKIDVNNNTIVIDVDAEEWIHQSQQQRRRS